MRCWTVECIFCKICPSHHVYLLLHVHVLLSTGHACTCRFHSACMSGCVMFSYFLLFLLLFLFVISKIHRTSFHLAWTSLRMYFLLRKMSICKISNAVAKRYTDIKETIPCKSKKRSEDDVKEGVGGFPSGRQHAEGRQGEEIRYVVSIISHENFNHENMRELSTQDIMMIRAIKEQALKCVFFIC